MKHANKSLKNRNHKVNHKVIPLVEITEAVEPVKEVSFIMVAKGVIGFRESAHIVKIADETNCTISIASGKNFGTNKSILSLVNLMLTSGKSLVLNIKGERNEEAFRAVSKIIAGETDGNS
ncbi:MAG: HPr family phosphocarrier protein [Selenomonadaceae bacterium]|nr:HPr family phosphocarrier protein [Selenomonadaceae bacterium]